MSTLRLKDGRVLGYEEYGDPQGAPLFYFHGFPNSRSGARVSHEAALHHRVRVVALDRPGFGLSDFKRGRTLGDWPDDVIEAADALGIDRFAVLGYSGGGPYAAACAARIPERLTAAGLVSGLGPLTEPAARKGFRLSTRIGMWFWQRFPFLVALAFWLMGLAVRRNADRVVRSLSRSMPAVDQAILTRPEVWAAMRDDYREAFRQGSRAAAHEMRLYLRRWDIDPKAIPLPVLLWHGDVDTTVPVSMGRFMASAIPNCRATFYPGEGHMLLIDRMNEIDGALLASQRTKSA